ADPDQRRLGRGHRARARPESRQLPGLPVPARVVLRAAVRGSARRLAGGRRPLRRARRVRGAGRADRADRRLAHRLLPVPVAVAGRAALVDEPPRPHPPRVRQLHRVAPRLRRVLRHRRRRGAALPALPRRAGRGLRGAPFREAQRDRRQRGGPAGPGERARGRRPAAGRLGAARSRPAPGDRRGRPCGRAAEREAAGREAGRKAMEVAPSVRASVLTVAGVYLVDLDDETVLGPSPDARFDPPPAARPFLPRLVAAAAAGSTVVAVVDAKPPLLVSHDAGATWQESGRGLPRGYAVALADQDPDRMLFATRNRLHVSTDGGRFWRSLSVELPDILAVSFDDG